METIFGNSSSNRRNGTRRSVYQPTPFGTPPLGRQADPLRGNYVSSSQHSSSCSGSSSWVLWRDEPSSLYHDPRVRRGRLCSVLLAVAAFLVVLTVLSIAGLAVYMGALRIDTNKPELVFDGSVCVTSGDNFVPSLGNNSSTAFKEMALKYQNMIDRVYQRSQIRPAYKKCVIEKFENGSLIVFFRLYLDRRKIPRNFQNIEETARDILVNELIAPRTAAFKNIQIDASSIFIKRSMDDAVTGPIEGMPKKKPSGNRTLQMHNGVIRKTITENTSILNKTNESSTVSKQENSEMKVTNTKDLKTKTQEAEGEAIPIIEGTVVITKIKETMEKPSDIPSTLKEGRNVTSSNADISSGESKSDNDTISKPSGNSGNKADRDTKGNSKHVLNSTAGIASTSEINPIEQNTQMKPQTDDKFSLENDDRNPIRPKTHPSYISSKKQSTQNYDKFNLGDETITKFSTTDVVRKDFIGTKQDYQGQNTGRPSGTVNGLDGKISHDGNDTLVIKTGEKDVLLMGSPEDFTANPLNLKTNTYSDHYHTHATSGLTSDLWNIDSRSTPIPNTKPTNLKATGAIHNYTDTEVTSQHFQESFLHIVDPPQIQSDEPWRPIMPHYTKHSLKPDNDDIGTGVAEVVVIPPSAVENKKTNEGHYHDNRYSSRLGQPAPTHKLQESSLGGYGSFSLHSDPQESQPDDTISRVSLHVVGSGSVSGENPETSILHTTSGGGIIIRKQHQPVMAATFLPPHTIPLTYTTSEPPSMRQSIANPFTIPELPILHQFHDVDAILKASPIKNAQPSATWISHQYKHFQGDFTVNTNSRNPDLYKGSVSSSNQQWIEGLNDTRSIVKPQYSSHRESFPARHHHQPPWADTGNRARPENSKIPFKDTDIPSAVTSVESPLPRMPENKSMKVQLATLNPMGDSVADTSFSIVTLIPVRSNSGVGRPLRPRPKLPSHISIQIKNENEPMNVTLNYEYTLRHKVGDSGYSSPTPPIASGPVNGVQQYEVSHKRQNNLAGSTNKSEEAMINSNQPTTEAPQQEVGITKMDHKSQSSGFKYSTQSQIFSRITSSASQQISTLTSHSPVTRSSTPVPKTDTVLTSINVTQTEVAPVFSTIRPVPAASIKKSASEKIMTMPPAKGTNLATSSTVTQITATTSPLRKIITTQQPSTEVKPNVTETLPPTSITKSAQTTIGTSPSSTSYALTAMLNESSLANAASNTNHKSQINKTFTDQTKNVTHVVENMIKIASVSTLNQRPSEGEVQKNITAGITNYNNMKIKEINVTNTSTSPTPSPHQQILTTKTTPSHLTHKNTVTAPKNSHSTVPLSAQPAIRHTTPSEFIPVIVIQDLPDDTWYKNNPNKQKANVSSSVSTLEAQSSTSNVPDGTGSQIENITRSTNVISSASSLRTSELRNNGNSSEKGISQNISMTISQLQGDNNSSKEKPESVKENMRNTTPQPNITTPQAVILHTDIVTTTSIEISFGENASKVIISPLNTSQSPNTVDNTITPNISSDRHNTENITTSKQVDSNLSSIMDLPITLPASVTETTFTHKVKETRRQPKMKLTNTYASTFKNMRLEERMMDSTGNMKMKDEMYTDLPMSQITDVTDTTTTLNIFGRKENGTNNTIIMVTKSEPENYNYSTIFYESRTVFEINSATESSISENYTFDQISSEEKELNSTTDSTTPENYGSEQFSSAEEDIILPQTNASSNLTKEASPQREEELPFTFTQSTVSQELTMQKVHEEIIPTTEEMSTALYEDSTPNEIYSPKDGLTNTSNEALETFTNFTVTKVTASSSKQDKQPPDDFEMSDDDVMLLLSVTRKNSFMSEEAVNTLSKYANVHTAISSNNVTKDSQNNIYEDHNKISNKTTESYVSDKITNNMAEEAKLSTKAILLHGSNNHAGIPILTKIYNKAPQQFSEKQATTEEGSPDLVNTAGCPSNQSLRCGDGECISSLSRCNQLVDCSDGIDEQSCTCADYLKAQFLTRKLCDGIVDCWDFSDENNCEWCSPGQFVCPNSQVCVDQHRLCDGARDCPYGDDEKQCVTVAQNEATAGDFPYNSEGYLMVRKQGRWGKLCLQNFDNVVARSQSAWEVADLGRAVCKAMTYSDFERVNRTIDTGSSSRADNSHYFELTYSSDVNNNNSQPRSSLSFQDTQCNQKEVVHISCRDLQCGIRPQAINQWAKIVGGGNAAPGSWPWQAALYKEGEFQCGATLIADRWLVSAGHCFYHALDDYWVARLGALRRGSSFPSPYEQLRPVSHIILHPGYVDAGFLNDISLLRLREPVQFSDFVRPVCLPPVPIRDGRLCTVVGWGQLFEVGRIFPDTLQEVQLPIISTAECRKRTLFLPLYRVTDNMFCAGFDRGGRDACLGDSGGPLMCQEKDGHWSLYGVTSNGYGCARANRPGVYTKVANYVPWLQAAMVQQLSSLRDSKTQCKGHRCPLGECLPLTRVCNGFMECSDGSDEKGCW